MVLDKQEHKDLLLQMLNGSQFPGHARGLVFDLGQSIESAAVAAPETVCINVPDQAEAKAAGSSSD